MKNVFKLLGVLVFLTFISVDAKSQYAGIEIVSGMYGDMYGENSCPESNVGFNEIVLPFCIFKERFSFTFPSSSQPRDLMLRTYDQNLNIVTERPYVLPPFFTYCSFVSTTYVLGIGFITIA